MLRSVFRDTDHTRWQKAKEFGWSLQRGHAGDKSPLTGTFVMCPSHFACFQDYAKGAFCHTLVTDANGELVSALAPSFFWNETVLAVGHTTLRKARDFAISREWRLQHERGLENLRLLLQEARQRKKDLVQAQEDQTSDFTHLHQRDQADIIQEYLDAEVDTSDIQDAASYQASKSEIYPHEVDALEQYLKRVASDEEYVERYSLYDREDHDDREHNEVCSEKTVPTQEQDAEVDAEVNEPDAVTWDAEEDDYQVPLVAFRKPRMVVPLRHKRSKLLYNYPVKPKRPEQTPLPQPTLLPSEDSEQSPAPPRAIRRTDLRIVCE